MIDEPRIALAASPREWAQRLHRHVADHGGARVRATVLQPRDALDEDYDVFVADDTTSFLTPHLVAQLRERGRAVIGVFDPDDPRGKEDLLEIGADEVLPRDAPPQTFVEAIQNASLTLRTPGREPEVVSRDTGTPDGTAPGERRTGGRGRTTAVAAVSGGAGATELAIALAVACGRRGESVVLVDADNVTPALAPRLGLPAYPNLRAAVDAVEQGGGLLADNLVGVQTGRFWALPGLTSAASWSEVRPEQGLETLRALATIRRQVLVDVGHRIEDLPAAGAPRHGLARLVITTADALVAVMAPTPAGIARLLEWVADLREFAPHVPLHVVCNRAPASSFKRAEISAEITRTITPAGLWFTPPDTRLDEAVWRQEVVTAGPFVRAVASLAGAALPPARAARSAGRGRWRRRAA